MSLQKLRSKIDRLDAELVRLLNERAELSLQVGSIKKATGISVFDPAREETLLQCIQKRNKGPLDHKGLRSIYHEILSSSRSLQKPLRIACLGPEGTYSHQAAMTRFGEGDHYATCRSIPEIFAIVSRGDADAGVVPIENSTEGGISASYDSLIHTDLTICGESYLKIQNALAVGPKTGKIQLICSHYQPLGQCRQWLAANYPNVPTVEVSSTTDGARRASREKGTAAIVSPFAAEIYGLKILASNISDAQRNATRFLIISRQQTSPSKNDKTSLFFAVPHRVGALSEVLQIFSKSKINLCKIESRPAPHQSWEYLFFVDIKGHRADPVVAKAFENVRKKTAWLKILGSYPEGCSDV